MHNHRSSGKACRKSNAVFPASSLQPLASASGFTLVEMAMVLVIMGFVMMIVFPALATMRSATQAQVTQSNLRSLILETAAYVQANGCLPCPANPGAVGTSFGRMNYPSTATVCGLCASPEGIPPFASMGIPASTARDGWGHWITMRVDPALTGNFGVVPPAAPCTASDVSGGICTATGISAKGMCKTGLPTTNRIIVTLPGGAAQQEAIVFVSHGKDGFGSFFAQPAGNGANGSQLPFTSNYAACSPSSNTGYARCNAAETTQFYDSPAYSTAADSYDDVLTYADRNSLVAIFGNGSCQTVW